jgi:glucosamine-6-phosphate deaminase
MSTESLLYGFTVRRFESRAQLGVRAARDVAETLGEILKTKDCVNMIFAAAPSQLEFLEAFRIDPQIDFTRIRAFHMDEYIGLPADAPQGFGAFLRRNLFDRVPFREVHFIDGLAGDPEAECARYARLLRQYPPDIVCMGIGENGHIAFNDPHVADFDDALSVKIVSLDPVCRQQQVNDACFEQLDDVPLSAITLTVPALALAPHHFCMVPAATKADAVRRTVMDAVTAACPATILRTCPHAILYVDLDSGSHLRFWPRGDTTKSP